MSPCDGRFALFADKLLTNRGQATTRPAFASCSGCSGNKPDVGVEGLTEALEGPCRRASDDANHSN
jgi:hypothetical protein